jgi:hypothetical protein
MRYDMLRLIVVTGRENSSPLIDAIGLTNAHHLDDHDFTGCGYCAAYGR